MKKIFIKLMLLLLPLLVLMGSVNYCVDSGDVFAARYVKVAGLITSGRNAGIQAVPSNWGKLQVSIVEQAKAKKLHWTRDIMVFGTSRSSEITASLFKNASFFNCAVPGGNVLDLIALYGLYKTNGMLPKYLIVNVDPWSFYDRKSTVINGETYSIADPDQPLKVSDGMEPYLDYSHKALDCPTGGKVGASDCLKAADFHKLCSLFSPSYFQVSLKSLESPTLHQPFATDVESAPSFFVIRRDGSYSLTEESKVDAGKVETVSRAFVAVQKGRFFIPQRIRKQYLDAFYQLIETAKRDGVVPIVYYSPINPILYDSLTRYEHNGIEEEIDNFCRKRNITVIGSFNPHTYGIDVTGKKFLDEYHPVKSLVRRVIYHHERDLNKVGIYLQPDTAS